MHLGHKVACVKVKKGIDIKLAFFSYFRCNKIRL